MKTLYKKNNIFVAISPEGYIYIESDGKEIIFCRLDEFNYYWVRQENDLEKYHPFEYRRVAGTQFFLPIDAIDEIKRYKESL